MIADLKPYSEYRDSGVPWLGGVPAHWETLPALAAYRPKQVKNTGMVETAVLSLSYGRIVIKPPEKLRGLVPESFETYQVVDQGNIIVRTTDLQNDQKSLRVGQSPQRGIITSAYMCLETTQRVSAEFGYQFLNAYDLLKIIYGFGSGLRQNLDFGQIKRMPILVPPPDEQAAIVRFLDNADRKIRLYIRTKQKLIKLLEEQRQKLVHGAVTRGLDFNVRRKPSGLQWLGDVPEHWCVSRSTHLFSARNELARPDDVQLSATQAYGVIAQADFEQKVGRRVVKITRNLERRRHVEKDDFVISMRSFQGGLERAWNSGCIRSSYVVLKPAPGVHTDYFEYLFKSYGYISALQATADFIRDGQDLNYSNFRLVPVPCPPLAEQRAIGDYLRKATAKIDELIRRSSLEIEFLREYRTRLIADVVTGKLDVRAAAAALPDDRDEPDAVVLDDDLLDAEEAEEPTAELEEVEV